MNIRRIVLSVSVLTCLAVLVCGCSDRLALAQRTVLDTTMNDGSLTTMGKGLEETDLDDTLRGATQYTVFAVTNDAFKKLPPNKFDAWFRDDENRDLLEALLKFHIVEGVYSAEQLEKMQTVVTLNGAEITFERIDDRLFVNGAEVVIKDIHCRNGIIHIIDSVLIPPCPRIPEEVDIEEAEESEAGAETESEEVPAPSLTE